MENHTAYTAPATSYKEVRIGNTIYRVTSFFSGEKDLGKTLEQLAVRRRCRRFLSLLHPALAVPHDFEHIFPACRILARRWRFEYHILTELHLWSHHAALDMKLDCREVK